MFVLWVARQFEIAPEGGDLHILLVSQLDIVLSLVKGLRKHSSGQAETGSTAPRSPGHSVGHQSCCVQR